MLLSLLHRSFIENLRVFPALLVPFIPFLVLFLRVVIVFLPMLIYQGLILDTVIHRECIILDQTTAALIEQVIAPLVPPDLIYAHGELVVPVGLHSQKLGSLLLTQILLVCLLDLSFVLRPLRLELLVKISRTVLSKAYVGHQDGLLVGICRQLVLFILVVQVGDVVVADAHCFVVLPAEKHAGLG